MTGAVWPTDDSEAAQSQMEEEDCTYNEGVTCTWKDAEEGRLLLIEGTEPSFVDPLTEAGGSEDYPTVRAYLFQGDLVVGLGFSLRFESDRTPPTAEEVAEILKRFRAVYAVGGPEFDEGTSAWSLGQAVESRIPGLSVDAEEVGISQAIDDFTPQEGKYGDDSFDLIRLGEGIGDYDGPVYGVEGSHMFFLSAELASGEQVLVYLQAQQLGEGVDDPDPDEARSQAQCGHAAKCEVTTLDPWTVSVHRTIEGDRPSLAALRYDTGDGWIWGVGIESADGSELPPVDFEQLEDVLAHLR
ncbi:hypothetical protein GCM10029992_15320 [Glycomyces albus]